MRKHQGKACTPMGGCGGDMAAVGFGDGTGDGQAQPGAVGIRVLPGRIGPVEASVLTDPRP